MVSSLSSFGFIQIVFYFFINYGKIINTCIYILTKDEKGTMTP